MTYWSPKLRPLVHLPWLNRGSSLITPLSGGLNSGLGSSRSWTWLPPALCPQSCPVSGSCSKEPQTSCGRHPLASPCLSSRRIAPKIFLALPEAGQAGQARERLLTVFIKLSQTFLVGSLPPPPCQYSLRLLGLTPATVEGIKPLVSVVLRVSTEVRETWLPQWSHTGSFPTSLSSCLTSWGPGAPL